MKKGFTLLELIIVIIIIGVLASLALPRMFAVVEYSRRAEAVMTIGSIRRAMERCYIEGGGRFTGCATGFLCAGGRAPGALWKEGKYGMEYPGSSPNAHFDYAIVLAYGGGTEGYSITAFRNTHDGGAPGYTDGIRFLHLGNNRIWCGTGAFEPIGSSPCQGWSTPSCS